MPLTREEKLERKKLSERRRRERLKNNEEFKAKNRARYYKRKAEGKILAIHDLNRREQKAKREKSRISSRKYNLKKKNQAKRCLDENLIQVPEIQNKENRDPLEDTLTPLLLSRADTPVSSVSGSSTRLSVSGDTPEQRPLSSNSYSSEPPSPSSNSTSFSSRRSARLNPVRVQQLTVRDTQPQNQTRNITETPKNTTSTSCVLRRFKYKVNKEFQLLHKRITELKAVNEKYKKQIYRMKNRSLEPQPSTSKIENKTEIITQKIKEERRKIQESVKLFFEDDEVSQLCPGKKDCVTRNKTKKQKRLLMDSLLNLHQKYLALHPDITISYSAFCKLRPFWVVIPNVNSRETCLCKTHENIDLVFAALKRNKIIEQKSLQEVFKYICCDSTANVCLKRMCEKCKDKQLLYNEFDNSQETHYWKWNSEKKHYTKDGIIKTSRIVAKQKIIASPKAIIKEFEKQLIPYMKHVSNIISQHRYIKQIKSNLEQNECIIHCDFSENYNAKYCREIQAVHFGGSRSQLTLHTVVLYYQKDSKMITKPICTVSESLRHDALAIWEHLLPILKFLEDEAPQVDALYFLSDSPSAQYRNRKMFFIMSILNWYYPSLRIVEWNYSESGHGKGAPDGVGGILKRTADQLVARGVDITDMKSLLQHLKKNVPGVYIETVSEAGMLEKELLIPLDLKEFPGTMGVHQVLWHADTGRIMTMRELSCGLEPCLHSTIQCPHGLHKGLYDVDLRITRKEELDKSVLIEIDPQKKTLKSDSVKAVKDKPVILSNILLKPGPSGSISETRVETKAAIKNYDLKRSTDDIELSDNDSFWVPGLTKEYEELMTPKTTKNVISCLNKDAEDSSDFDDSIFTKEYEKLMTPKTTKDVMSCLNKDTEDSSDFDDSIFTKKYEKLMTPKTTKDVIFCLNKDAEDSSDFDDSIF